MDVRNLDAAYEKFKKRIEAMPDDEFWALLGTSIEDLKKIAEEDCEE